MTTPTLALLLLLAPTARATRVSYQDQPCPLDPDDTVRVYERLSSNTQGGYDSDGAIYSSQGQFRTYAVATCARTLFSLYGGDMGIQLDEGQRAALREALARARAELADPANPEVWERYALAAVMYETLGRGPLFLADLWIDASWTARDEAVGVFLGLKGPETVREALRLGEAELARAPDAAARRTLLFNLARIAHRGGYNAERDRWLAAFQQAGPMDEKQAAALARFLRMAHRVEPALQDKAIAELRRGLLDRNLPVEQRMRATYLLADLLRRRDQPAEALGLYKLVLAEDRSPAQLRALALHLVGELQG